MSCNSCLGTFLQLMMFEQQMQYMSESMFMLNFPNASVAEQWCYANDVSYGIIELLV